MTPTCTESCLWHRLRNWSYGAPLLDLTKRGLVIAPTRSVAGFDSDQFAGFGEFLVRAGEVALRPVRGDDATCDALRAHLAWTTSVFSVPLSGFSLLQKAKR
jgi:hypothetical protein